MTSATTLRATILFAAILLLIYSSASIAQTKRRPSTNRKPPVATPNRAARPTASPTPASGTSATPASATQPASARQPASTTQPTARPTSPIPLVVVNGQTLTTADLDPQLRQDVEAVEQKIAEARQSVLDLQINTILLQVEAKKRRVDTHRLYETEVSRRAGTPTPAQIQKFIEENKAQFQGMDPATVNHQVTAYLHDEAESKLADDLVKRLRQTIPVVMGADVNAPNLADDTVLATIGGQPLKAAAVKERLKPIIYRIRLDAYVRAKQHADQIVNNMLLLDEAKRRQVGPEEIVRAEISEKVRPPTEAEVSKFYNDNKARISGDLNSVRRQVAMYLQEEDKRRLERELSDRLRKSADIRWLITEPAQPVQNISVDDDPARGSANAPVTIVEFTDFQCPACAAMHPVIEEVLKSYGDKVRLVVRDFPLNQHEWARKAAEAANAANEQGKFFEYAALLFQRQKALDVPSLKKYASELGLDRTRFDAALDRGTFAAEVKHDIEDGELYGVGSTPTIFINGVQLRVLSADGLREAIDRAAKSASGTQPK
ncbi:MAG: thioredoxin domain-containing protein [Acidobacteria bacterium]|nr:thioredoxin domain-containing protein [Acidobacteriota bacterium]MCA1627176.1 thioredoxin domain-containing protein [Acidobacteriota bacterium]